MIYLTRRLDPLLHYALAALGGLLVAAGLAFLALPLARAFPLLITIAVTAVAQFATAALVRLMDPDLARRLQEESQGAVSE